jgi:hypothetical protein
VSLALANLPPLTLRLNRLFAFLGRYAHQQVPDLLGMTVSELRLLAKCTAEILEDERKAANTHEGD